VSRSRGIPEPALRRILDSVALLTPEEALRERLADRIAYGDEVTALLKRLSGARGEDARIREVSVAEYAEAMGVSGEGDGEKKIAVVYAVGTIMPGRSRSDPNPILADRTLGSESFSQAMREARESDRVAAVVVRIDSPGGSAAASEEMWRQVELTTREKPVYVSMGGTAASGGYYLAAAADTILADRATLTGSIGVFSIRFSMKELLEKKLGIATQTVTSNPHADMLSPARPFTDRERTILGRHTDSTYGRFLEVVAEGRSRSLEHVRSVAEGRVWTGAAARAQGLVDIIGGLDAAIDLAAVRVGRSRESLGLRVLPRPRTFFEQIDDLLDEGAVKVAAGRGEKWEMAAETALGVIDRLSGPQAWMPGIRVE
jgi:protease IV